MTTLTLILSIISIILSVATIIVSYVFSDKVWVIYARLVTIAALLLVCIAKLAIEIYIERISIVNIIAIPLLCVCMILSTMIVIRHRRSVRAQQRFDAQQRILNELSESLTQNHQK